VAEVLHWAEGMRREIGDGSGSGGDGGPPA
jgi:hypothetical protein